MMHSKTLMVAVIGLGVGEQHANTYRSIEGCQLRWLFDFSHEDIQRVIKKLQQGKPASSFEQILLDKSVDIVSIATYDHHHASQVVNALAAGKHVFVEKPLCQSFEELEKIKDQWQKGKQNVLSSNLVLRAAPLYRWLKEYIYAGELGEIYSFDGDYLYGRIHKITEGWRKDVPNYAVMLGGGIHMVDLMIWLLGEKPDCVTASGNRICTRGTAYRYEDYVCSTYQFPSGAIGRITANFGCVHKHQHVIRLFGSKKTFIYDDQGPRLYDQRDPGSPSPTIDYAPKAATKGDLIPRFVKTIREGANAHFEAHREFDLITACLFANLSLRTGSTEKIIYS